MKFTTKTIAIAEVAKSILSKQANFLMGDWARGPVFDHATLPRNVRRFSASFREDIEGDSHFDKANDPKACAWCFEGAVMKAAGDLGYSEHDARTCISDLCNAAGGTDKAPVYRRLRTLNDSKGHAAVVAAVGTAIARLKKTFKAAQKKEAC